MGLIHMTYLNTEKPVQKFEVIPALIGAAAIGAGSSILGGLLSNYSAKNLNNQNLEFQKEQLEYQKNLQQQIFAREDNAIQRAAADLKAAGLSKTLAAGQGAGTGAIVSTTTPQNDIAATIAPQLEMARMQQGMMTEAVNTALNVKQIEAQIKNQEREQNRADLLAGQQIKASDWQIGMGNKQFNQTLEEFKNLKSYQEFEKLMQDRYYKLANTEAGFKNEMMKQQNETMKRWLEYGDDEEHRKLPTEIKQWMWQYNKTHSWENVGWNLANKGVDVLGNIIQGWGTPNGIFGGTLPTYRPRTIK